MLIIDSYHDQNIIEAAYNSSSVSVSSSLQLVSNVY